MNLIINFFRQNKIRDEGASKLGEDLMKLPNLTDLNLEIP
jgi:hypothetical protein